MVLDTPTLFNSESAPKSIEVPHLATVIREGQNVNKFDVNEQSKSFPLNYPQLNASSDNINVPIPTDWKGEKSHIHVNNYYQTIKPLNNSQFASNSDPWAYVEFSPNDDISSLAGSYNAAGENVNISFAAKPYENQNAVYENFTSSIPASWTYAENPSSPQLAGYWSSVNGGSICLDASKINSAGSLMSYSSIFTIEEYYIGSASLIFQWSFEADAGFSKNANMSVSILKYIEGRWIPQLVRNVYYGGITQSASYEITDVKSAFATGSGEYKIEMAVICYETSTTVGFNAYFSDIQLALQTRNNFAPGTIAKWNQLVNLTAWEAWNVGGADLYLNYTAPTNLPASDAIILDFSINNTNNDEGVAFSSLVTDLQKHQLIFSLNSTLLSKLDGLWANVSVGIRIISNQFILFEDTHLLLDDITLVVYFSAQDCAAANIQVKTSEMGGWIPFDETNALWLTGAWENNVIFQFETSMVNILLNVTLSVFLIREQIEIANASYRITAPNATSIMWNVSYSTEQSINTLQSYSSYYDVSTFNMTFCNLPAVDYLGVNSEDWGLQSVYGPNAVNYMGIALHTSTAAHLQNLSIPSGVLDWGTQGKGPWRIQATQQNYINRTWLENSTHDLLAITFATNQTFYNATVRNATINGNFKISILNSSFETIAGWPQYFNDVQSAISGLWEVNDLIPGQYWLVSEWNDTAGEKTLRLGYANYTFDVYRTTTSVFQAIGNDDGENDIGHFIVGYNSSLTNQGIIGANIFVYNNATNNFWGEDWTGVYQIENLQYLGSGNYSFDLTKFNVPAGIFDIKIVIAKPYHLTQIIYSTMNQSGLILNYTFTEGVFFDGMNYQLLPTSTPYVNQTSGCQITVMVRDFNTMTPLTDAIIMARIGTVSQIWQEVFKTTGFSADRGKYIIFISGANLHNDTIYNLALSISKTGYNVNATQIFFSPKLIPTGVEVQASDTLIEEGTITLFANYLDLAGGTPKGISNALVEWQILNESMIPQFGGILAYTFAGVYSQLITFQESFYLPPGQYWFYVHATGTDYENATSIEKTLQILPKNGTKLEINIIGNVRLGQQISIQSNLTYNNGSAIPNQPIQLMVQFDLSPPTIYQIYTNIFGIAEFNSVLGGSYANITLNATYAGTPAIYATEDSVFSTILPKYWSNLEFINPPTNIQNGLTYDIEFDLTLEVGIPSGFELDYFYSTAPENIILEDKLFFSDSAKNTIKIPEIPDGVNQLHLNLSYKGNSIYSADSLTLSFGILQKINTKLIVIQTPNSAFDNEPVIIKIKLSYEDERGIPNRIISCLIDTEKINSVTDGEGIATFSFDKIESAGKFNPIFVFEGGDILSPSSPLQVEIEIRSFAQYQDQIIRNALIYTLISGIVVGSVIFAVNLKVIKPRKRQRLQEIRRLEDRFLDVQNVRLIQIIAPGGTYIFSHSLSELPMDPSIVSGFITAITTFGSQMMGPSDGEFSESGLRELTYREFKIFVHDGKMVKIALLSIEKLSDAYEKQVMEFLNVFEQEFKTRIETYEGEEIEYPELRSYCNRYLYTHLLEIASIDENRFKEIKPTPMEKLIYLMATGPLFEGNFRINKIYQRLNSLYSDKKLEILQGIFHLLEEKVIVPNK
jgi:hypothetical protein